jgi:hypothetical protein
VSSCKQCLDTGEYSVINLPQSFSSSLRVMTNSYLSTQKNKYRITLELDVMQDFNPHQIDWNKVFKLEPNESVNSYVEDLSIRW